MLIKVNYKLPLLNKGIPKCTCKNLTLFHWIIIDVLLLITNREVVYCIVYKIRGTLLIPNWGVFALQQQHGKQNTALRRNVQRLVEMFAAAFATRSDPSQRNQK